MAAATPSNPNRRRLLLKQKLALAGGASVAVAGAAIVPSAEAGIVQSTTLPLSPPSSFGANFWDVDGDGTDDFKLKNNTTTAQLTELGAARFVAPNAVGADGFAKLASGFTVGPTMAGFKFFPSAQNGISITTIGTAGNDLADNGWGLGDVGYFGFKFTNVSGVHYGWGQVDIHGISGGFGMGQGFTFTEAYYNTTPNATIKVGDTGGSPVPEIDPASASGVLSLVMGSLAMLERRRRRQGDAAVSA